jgi:hypothetical protein
VLGNHPDNARKKASLEVAELPASITEF